MSYRVDQCENTIKNYEQQIRSCDWQIEQYRKEIEYRRGQIASRTPRYKNKADADRAGNDSDRRSIAHVQENIKRIQETKKNFQKCLAEAKSNLAKAKAEDREQAAREKQTAKDRQAREKQEEKERQAREKQAAKATHTTSSSSGSYSSSSSSSSSYTTSSYREQTMEEMMAELAELNRKNAAAERERLAREAAEKQRKKEADRAERKRLGWKYYLKPKFYKYYIGVLLVLSYLAYNAIHHWQLQQLENRQYEQVMVYIAENHPDSALVYTGKMERLSDAHALKILTTLCDSAYLNEAIQMITVVHPSHGIYSSYSQKGTQCIYPLLLNAGRYDELWKFHDWSMTDEPTGYTDAIAYYQCLEDAVRHMCETGKKRNAKSFVQSKSRWFHNNVEKDKSEACLSWQEYHPDYTKSAVRKRLNNIIDEY